MSEWTHFSATVTIENSRELNPLPFLKMVDKFQQMVADGKCTWEDIDDTVAWNNGINTAMARCQFLQECFVPEVTLVKPEVKYQNDMKNVIIDNGSTYVEITAHPVPCPFKTAFPLEHHKCSVRFFKNISPDGNLITFTYEGDIEEWISDKDVDNWLNCMQEYFNVRSGVVGIHRNDGGETKFWSVGRI